MVICSNGDTDCKSFKVHGSGIGFKGGSYKAKTFSVAASRAGSKIFQKIDKDEEFMKYSKKDTIKFILGETTRGSNKKTKAYIVTRTKIVNPKVVMIAGKEVIYKYKYHTEQLKTETESDISKMIEESQPKQMKKMKKNHKPVSVNALTKPNSKNQVILSV